MSPTWWISVADLRLPADEQFRGVVITEAPTVVEAVHVACLLGLAGGQATCGRVPDQFEAVYRPYLDRVLDRDEAEFVAAMQPLLS